MRANCHEAVARVIQGMFRDESSMSGSHGSQPLRFATPADALGYEIVQEQAAALGRLGRGLERALQALRDCEAVSTAAESMSAENRSRLVADAAQALWMYIVQREACGLRDSRAVMRDYRVPAEVQYRMGASVVRKP
jgi:hypothetical protein